MHSTITVGTAATSNLLVTLETVKSELGITDNSQDEKLERWIEQASQAIASYCRRVFGLETVTEVFRPKEQYQKLLLSRFPVGTVTSVTVGSTVLEATDFEVNKANGIMARLCGDSEICWECGKISVVYSGGYDLPDGAPADLQAACSELVNLMYSSTKRDPLAKRIEIPGIRTVDYWVGGFGSSGGLPPQVGAALEPYRNVRV